MAFAPNQQPTFAKQPQMARVQIANADASAQKTVLTAGANGSKLIGVIVASTDTSNRDVTMSITNGGTAFPLVTKTIPLSSGTVAGTAGVNLLDTTLLVGMPLDNDGNPFLFLVSGDTLTVNALTTVTSGKLITVHAIYEDF